MICIECLILDLSLVVTNDIKENCAKHSLNVIIKSNKKIYRLTFVDTKHISYLYSFIM